MNRQDIQIPASLALVIAIGFIWLICGQADTRIALDTDVVNLALSIENFDVRTHQPHPPGYLGYVILLKVTHIVTGLDPIATTKLVARLMVTLTLILIYVTARTLVPSRVPVALWSVAFAATSPMLLYYGVDGQTHAAEAAAAAALLWRLARHHKREPGYRDHMGAASVGLILAIGASFRPSFALLAIAPVLWCFWREWRGLAIIAVTGGIGTLAWLLPTVYLSGGWQAYQETSDALVGLFVRKTSILSSASDSRMVWDNFLGVLLWTSIVGFAIPIALYIGRKRDGFRFASVLLATMAIPAIVFYALVFIAEAGYLLGLVPAICIVIGIAIAAVPHRRLQWIGGSIVSIQLGFFFVAPTPTNSALLFIPSLSEITLRQASAEAALQAITANVRPEDRILVITDQGATFIVRQLPLLRPNTDVLFVHSAKLAVFDETTISLATSESWRGAPGPNLVQSGPPSTLHTKATYDFILVGPSYSRLLQRKLAEQTSCIATNNSDPMQILQFPATPCFPDHSISIGMHQFHWHHTDDSVTVD